MSKTKIKAKRLIIDAIHILLGNIILAFGITVILKPNNLITGGTTGFAIVLGKMTGIDFTVLIYAMSLIILLATWLVLGKAEARKIIVMSLVFPTVLMVFNNLFPGEAFNLTKGDMFLSSIYYGLLAGLGVGLYLKRGYSGGGTDTIAKMLHRKLFPFVSISQIMFVLDITVITSSVFVFDIRTALYAVITQMVFTKTVESILYGFAVTLVKVEILSVKEEEIEDYIMNEIKRGISKYNVIGGYSNLARTKLITVCSQRESMLIREMIAQVDQEAFVVASPVVSVWGKGTDFDSLIDEHR